MPRKGFALTSAPSVTSEAMASHWLFRAAHVNASSNTSWRSKARFQVGKNSGA